MNNTKTFTYPVKAKEIISAYEKINSEQATPWAEEFLNTMVALVNKAYKDGCNAAYKAKYTEAYKQGYADGKKATATA